MLACLALLQACVFLSCGVSDSVQFRNLSLLGQCRAKIQRKRNRYEAERGWGKNYVHRVETILLGILSLPGVHTKVVVDIQITDRTGRLI
jgi:hypothetical protein